MKKAGFCKVITTILLVAAMVCMMLTFVSAASKTDAISSRTIHEAYDYPVKKGTAEWAELTTIQDKIEACQIPENILEKMTTEALIETVKNYPLGINIYAYSSIDMGYAKVKSQFNGLQELEKRMLEENVATAMILDEYAVQVIEKETEATFEDCFIDTVRGCINRTVTEMEENEGDGTLSIQATSTYVTTPNGTRVSAIRDNTWDDLYQSSFGQITQASAQLAHEEVQETYPSVTYVRGINPAYNCHSYAWYSTSANNRYWINDPSDYILDGSHGEASYYPVGGKILYGTAGNSPEHSAIITEVSDYHHLTYVTSKWGCLGVYKHLYYDCPYASGIKPYHDTLSE